MPEHDGGVADTKCACGIHIFEIARPQEFGTHHPDEADPREQQHNAEKHEEAGRQDGGDDQQDVEHRHGRPDLDEALHQEIGPAAEITLNRTGRHTNDGRADGERQAEKNRDAEAINDTRRDVARLVICTEPIEIAERTAGISRPLRIAGATLLLGHQPEGWRGCGMGNIGIYSLIGIADRRPDHPAIGVDLVLNIGGFIVGLSQEAAELFFGVVHQDRNEKLALVGRQDRLVIGDELGAEAEAEKRQEYPEGPVAAAVRLEVLPTANARR